MTEQQNSREKYNPAYTAEGAVLISLGERFNSISNREIQKKAKSLKPNGWSTAVGIAFYLARAIGKNKRCMRAKDTIADDLGLGGSTVDRGVALLEAIGLIVIETVPGHAHFYWWGERPDGYLEGKSRDNRSEGVQDEGDSEGRLSGVQSKYGRGSERAPNKKKNKKPNKKAGSTADGDLVTVKRSTDTSESADCLERYLNIYPDDLIPKERETRIRWDVLVSSGVNPKDLVRFAMYIRHNFERAKPQDRQFFRRSHTVLTPDHDGYFEKHPDWRLHAPPLDASSEPDWFGPAGKLVRDMAQAEQARYGIPYPLPEYLNHKRNFGRHDDRLWSDYLPKSATRLRSVPDMRDQVIARVSRQNGSTEQKKEWQAYFSDPVFLPEQSAEWIGRYLEFPFPVEFHKHRRERLEGLRKYLLAAGR